MNDYINKYAIPISKCANYACQQMYDNYYNIFNALLTAPVKVGEANNNDQQQAGNNAQNQGNTDTDNQTANGEQPAGDNKQ